MMLHMRLDNLFRRLRYTALFVGARTISVNVQTPLCLHIQAPETFLPGTYDLARCTCFLSSFLKVDLAIRLCDRLGSNVALARSS